MMICLTHKQTGTKIAISHHLILCIRRGEDGLTNWVMTGIQGPKGPVAYEIIESAEEVGRMINLAQNAETTNQLPDPILLGYRQDN